MGGSGVLMTGGFARFFELDQAQQLVAVFEGHGFTCRREPPRWARRRRYSASTRSRHGSARVPQVVGELPVSAVVGCVQRDGKVGSSWPGRWGAG